MKPTKYLQIILFTILTFSLSVSSVIAQNGTIIPPISGDLGDLFGRVTFILRPVVLISFVAMGFWGGYLRMTAKGDPEQEKRSSAVLTSAIIGFLLILATPLVLSLLLQVLNVPSII